MKFDNNSTFPHPVLGLRDDIDSIADFEYTKTSDALEYIYYIEIKTDNQSIEKYIVEKKAEYVCEVDCKKTFYRKCITSKTPKFELHIPRNSVHGEVNITLTANAMCTITGYSNSKANEDYNDYEFDLEKGDIMAHYGAVEMQTDVTADEFKAVGSFMQFKKGPEGAQIDYHTDGDDIVAVIPKEMYEAYVLRLKGERFRPAIMASVVNEALICALMQMKEDDDRRWARIISSAPVCEDDSFPLADVKEAIDLASKILQQPHTKLFTSLCEMTNDDDE
jgi:hypothetical protein